MKWNCVYASLSPDVNFTCGFCHLRRFLSALRWQMALSSSHWFGFIFCSWRMWRRVAHLYMSVKGSSTCHDVTRMKRGTGEESVGIITCTSCYLSIIIWCLIFQCLLSLVFETLLFPGEHITVWQMAHVPPFIALQHHMTNGFHSSLLGSLSLFFWFFSFKNSHMDVHGL